MIHKYYSGAVADTDLVAACATLLDSVQPLQQGNVNAGRPTKMIVALVSGVLKIKTASGSTDFVPMAVGIPIVVDAVSVVGSGSTVTGVTYFW